MGGRPLVISRLNRPAALPGVTVPPAKLPRVDLAILTSDQALYAHDPVHTTLSSLRLRWPVALRNQP